MSQQAKKGAGFVMSYAVLHMQKMKGPAIKGMQIHNQREKESRTNEDIDPERSDLNYDVLHDQKVNYKKMIDREIEKRYTGKRAVRKDAVKLCSFMITSDKPFFDKLSAEDEKRFFQQSVEFLQNRYGKENIVYASVHKDEKTPHMHVGMVPITNEGKLSAKEFFGQRSELQSLQTDFHNHVKELGFDLERGEKGSDRKHIETQKFKKQTLEQDIQALEGDLKEKKQHLDTLQTNIKGSEGVQHKLETITADNKEKTSMGFLGGSPVVEMPKEKYEQLHDLASQSFQHRQQVTEYEKRYKETNQKLEKTEETLIAFKKQNKSLKEQVDFLQASLKRFKEIAKEKYQDIGRLIGRAKGLAHEELGKDRLQKYMVLDEDKEEIAGLKEGKEEAKNLKEKEKQQAVEKRKERKKDRGMSL